MDIKNQESVEVVMIGAGIMSATLAVLLKELNPNIHITIYEKLDVISGESSDALNNAGTGHSGFCELNYTPEDENGNINISKAVEIASSFEISKEFWAYLVSIGQIQNPEDFIHQVPHMSFVTGDSDIAFLKKRWEQMKLHPLFDGMQFSDNREQLAEWIPVMMKDRDPAEKVAATKIDIGTDVNYGALTRMLIQHLFVNKKIQLKVAHMVTDLKKVGKKWLIKAKNLTTENKIEKEADFVFIGAGGGAIQLLDKSGIEESKGYGGFPVSGEWLICQNPDVIKKHHAKVYGKAKVGAPPMSVPHLDSRVINGQHELLFGPFAGFSTKFLKNGSIWDLPLSIEWSNIKPMLYAGLHNLPLTKYLIQQVSQSKDDKVDALREFFPNADGDKWVEKIAGQRVQIIKKDEKEGGVLQFGTEIVSSKDGSIAALLGASPGASTAVKIMLDLLEQCFPENMKEWEEDIKKMIPSFKNPNVSEDYYKNSRKRTHQLLKLEQHKEENIVH